MRTISIDLTARDYNLGQVYSVLSTLNVVKSVDYSAIRQTVFVELNSTIYSKEDLMGFINGKKVMVN